MPSICSFLRISVVVGLAMLIVDSTYAQVVIRERVEVDSEQQFVEIPAAFSDGAGEVSIIADRDGLLIIEYGFMRRAGTPFPPTGVSLQVFRNDTLLVDNPVFDRTWAEGSQFRTCSGDGSTYTEFTYGVTDTLDVVDVVEGDAIDFLFITDRGTYGDDPFEGGTEIRPEGGWAVAIGGFDPFCNAFIDLLEVIVEIEPSCSESGLGPSCGGATASFIQRDNMEIPADVCMMVSREITSIKLPTSATYEGPPGSNPDPYTYRIEARDLPPGDSVSFRIEHREAVGGATNTYDYGFVEGEEIVGTDTFAVYRMDQHVRLVSNGIPLSGADPTATYDDEYNDDQTLLVKLEDEISGIVFNSFGFEIGTTDTLTVGCPPTDPDPQGIRSARVYFREYGDVPVTANPLVSVEKASEDWAQAAIRFTHHGTGAPFFAVRNILFVAGEASQGGVVSLRVVDIDAADTLDVALFVHAGLDARRVAERIADSVNVDPRFTSEFVRHTPPEGSDDDGWLVLVNPGNDVLFENIGFPAGLGVIAPALAFPPLTTGATMGVFEHHVIGLNYRDGGDNIIHVFVLPDTSMGAPTAGLVYRFSQNTLPGVHNAVFIDERATDGDDTDLPFTFGHELGHILDLGHVNNQFKQTNLMYFEGHPNEREGDLGRKRLEQMQVDTVRQSSGPGSNNPILEQN